jgi:FkbM family methyltransferase
MARDAIAKICTNLPGGRYILGACNHVLGAVRPRRKERTYFGAVMECDSRDLIQARIARFGVWEPNISAAFHQVLKPGDTMVDVGANVGFHSLLAAHLVGPTGRVVAIEPSPLIAEHLERHRRLNGAENLRISRVAVADRAGELSLYAGPSYNQGATTSVPSRGQRPLTTAPALPLDEILTAEERSRVRLIKIDIEGAEAPVLHRFLDTLDLYSEQVSVIVEVSPQDQSGSSWPELFGRFCKAGFTAYAIRNDYDCWSYLRWTEPLTPTLLDSPPSQQTDVLFSRTYAPGADRPSQKELHPAA